jgi:hypothetical protein
MSTPMATPTATAATGAEARTIFSTGTSTSTSETQTGDYKCRKCEEPVKKTAEAPNSLEEQGCKWSREELLNLRDRVAKMPKAAESNGTLPVFKAVAVTASPSI